MSVTDLTRDRQQDRQQDRLQGQERAQAQHRTPRLSQVPDVATAPLRLRIPAIGVDAHVLPLGLDARGAMEVPGFEDAMKVGWYTPGPRPGTPGPTVLVGHRDAPAVAPRRGYRAAVFARLDHLTPGDRVETQSGDGRRVRFRVTSVDTYRMTVFPSRKVYGPVRDSQLRLITCGGALDRDDGHWNSNVVVSAVQEEQDGRKGQGEQEGRDGELGVRERELGTPQAARSFSPESADGSVRGPGSPTAP